MSLLKRQRIKRIMRHLLIRLIGIFFIVLGFWIYFQSTTIVEAKPLEEALIYLVHKPFKSIVSIFGSLFGLFIMVMGSYITFLPLLKKMP